MRESPFDHESPSVDRFGSGSQFDSSHERLGRPVFDDRSPSHRTTSCPETRGRRLYLMTVLSPGVRSCTKWVGLASLLAASGVSHFLRPDFFDKIVPKSLPGSQRMWTLVSGGAELAAALTVAIPRSRRHGSILAGLIFLVVWPANFKMAFDWRERPPLQRWLAYGRLPVQLPLLSLARQVWRSAQDPSSNVQRFVTR